MLTFSIGANDISQIITVFSYLNYPTVWQRLKATNALIRQELETAQDAYNYATGSQTKILDCWDQWLAEHLAKVVQHGTKWTTQGLADLENQWLPAKGTQLGAKVLVIIQGLRREMAKHMKLDLADLV